MSLRPDAHGRRRPWWAWAFWGLALALFATVPHPAHGREQGESLRDRVDGFLETLGSGEGYDPEKLIDFGILPGPFYTPEMELGIGIAAIGLYKTDRHDEHERISTLSISGFASITGAVGLNVTNQSFFSRDRLRLFVNGLVFDAPDKYWGVGYETNADDANDEDYTHISYQASPRVYLRLVDALYIGTGWDVQYSHARDTAPGGLFHQGNPHGTKVCSSGYSFHLMSDTRDFIPNPFTGHLLNLDHYAYGTNLGSDTDHTVTELTGSTYWAPQAKTILAVQGFIRSASGDVPWSDLSKIGGASRMRGYWEGRYRDKKMVTAQIEYRRRLAWRHGIVGWVGAGAIAPSFGKFKSDEILPNAGVGYRLAFKDRSNVRLDLGFGKNEIGFYFNVNEAF